MKAYNFYIPTRIVFGAQTINSLNEYLPKQNCKLLIVTDKVLVDNTDIINKVTNILNSDYIIFDETEENPSLETISKGAKLARDSKVDFIIGIGGGSSMDAAKGIAILATNNGSMLDYIGGTELENDPLPNICIPTTSGTGSEVTPFAVFTDKKNEVKTAIAHDKIFPQTAILDPELTYSMPRSVILNTGLDALTHSIEAYLSTESFELNNQYALESIRIVIDNLEQAANKNPEAMQQMAHASMFGGIAIAHASTILPHIMGYPLTVYHNIPHGLANAIILPGFLRFMQKHSTVSDKVNQIVKMFEMHGGVEKFVIGLGISVKLSDYGINKEEFELFAKKTIVKGDVKITPAPITEQSIMDIYSDSL